MPHSFYPFIVTLNVMEQVPVIIYISLFFSLSHEVNKTQKMHLVMLARNDKKRKSDCLQSTATGDSVTISWSVWFDAYLFPTQFELFMKVLTWRENSGIQNADQCWEMKGLIQLQFKRFKQKLLKKNNKHTKVNSIKLSSMSAHYYAIFCSFLTSITF